MKKCTELITLTGCQALLLITDPTTNQRIYVVATHKLRPVFESFEVQKLLYESLNSDIVNDIDIDDGSSTTITRSGSIGHRSDTPLHIATRSLPDPIPMPALEVPTIVPRPPPMSFPFHERI